MSRVWRKFRLYFRRFRVAVWLVVFAVIGALLYLNLIGLPDAVKRPLLEKLRARGIEVQFRDLRLSFYRGLVARDVRFGSPEEPLAPQLTAERVEISFVGATLWRLNFQPGGLLLRNGRLVWPLGDTNELVLPPEAGSRRREEAEDHGQRGNPPPHVGGYELAVEKIDADLRFHSDDQWELRNLEGQLAGNKIRVSGSLSNALAVRYWKIFHPSQTNAPLAAEKLRAQLRQFAAALQQTRFGAPVGLRVEFAGDARDPNSLAGTVNLTAPDVATPQGAVKGGRFFACFAPNPKAPKTTDDGWGWWAGFSPYALEWRADCGELRSPKLAFTQFSAQGSWRAPDFALANLHLHLYEGTVDAHATVDVATRQTTFDSAVDFDLQQLRPFLTEKAAAWLGKCSWEKPPTLHVTGSLQWPAWTNRQPDWRGAVLPTLHAEGDVEVGNAGFRGETLSHGSARFDYTNMWLRLIEPRVERDAERGAADGLAIDLAEKMMYLTNAVTTLSPVAVAHAIGPKTTHILEPYQFLQPPLAHVNGSFSTENARRADLRFEIEGGPFRWWKFNLPHIAGTLVWSNASLLLTNIVADFYQGRATGFAAFDFSPAVGDDYNFDLDARNARLDLLMADLTTSTNRLEGLLDTRLTVTHANTRDWQSWQGYGDLRLRDGQLWEIPVFGIFARVLDGFYPNLGSGKARDGQADFTISNSVIASDNLELRSPAMRMQYRGTVDFAGNLHARAEAEALRNTAVIGPVVSTVLWPVTKLLEYKVTGTLAKPVAEPAYVPKLLLFPFHPFSTLKKLFTDPGPPATNAPPKFFEPPAGELK